MANFIINVWAFLHDHYTQFVCAFHVVAHAHSIGRWSVERTMVARNSRRHTHTLTHTAYQSQLAPIHKHTNTANGRTMTKSENFRTTKRIEYRNIWPK